MSFVVSSPVIRFRGNPFQPLFVKRLQKMPPESLARLKALNECAFKPELAPTPKHVREINGTKVNVAHIGQAKQATQQDPFMMKLFKTIVRLRRLIEHGKQPATRQRARTVLDGLHNAINVVTKTRNPKTGGE